MACLIFNHQNWEKKLREKKDSGSLYIFSGSHMLFALLLLLFSMQPLYASEPADSIDFTRLAEFAEYANAAYLSKEEIRERLKQNNFDITRYNILPESQVSYFLATDDVSKTQLIAVRGTSNIENAIVDIALQLKQDEHTGLRLHAGFASAARQIYTDIQPWLKKEYSINITGHSLGGAVALILAKYLDSDSYRVDQVITFGQPKVTNLAGAKSFEHLNIIRVVTPLDLVPLVPPFDPMDINNLDIYWHCGQEVLLLSDIKYSLLEGMNSMLRTTKFTQKRLSEDNLQNHRMALYLKLLNQKKISNQLVPFKNSFNLFNLFGTE